MNDSVILAKRFLETHRNPIRRYEPAGHKLFIPQTTEDELEQVKSGLSRLKHVLDQERVERRCGRVTAEWLPVERLAKLNKGGKILETYGFVNKSGRFLYPEEALLLLEINRIELILGKVPLSIQKAYEILISSCDDLNKYLAYRKLSIQGFRLLRTGHPLKSGDEQECPPTKKRRLETEQIQTISSTACSNSNDQILSKLDEVSTKESVSDVQAQEKIKDIFSKLQENGPKQYFNITVTHQPDYKMFSPENTSRAVHDFNLITSLSKYFDPKLGFSTHSVPTIVNYASSDFMGYFQIGQVGLPSLF